MLGSGGGVQSMPLLATSEWPPVYYAIHIIEYGYWVCNKKKKIRLEGSHRIHGEKEPTLLVARIAAWGTRFIQLGSQPGALLFWCAHKPGNAFFNLHAKAICLVWCITMGLTIVQNQYDLR